MLLISIRAPARGATGSTLQCFRFVIQFQSALPRGERRSGAIRLNNFFIISIRAPARGATFVRQISLYNFGFQSALPRGERLRNYEYTEEFTDFNPRSREGSDYQRAKNEMIVFISIRAPARGATDSEWDMDLLHGISIRAPARGATDEDGKTIRGTGFQSALPRGERRDHYHKGSVRTGISIRAPARGATHRFADDGFYLIISIRAPARGATFYLTCLSPFVTHFNPRSREGSDSKNRNGYRHAGNFNPRSREGSDVEP